MRVIQTSRRGGKTLRMMRWLVGNPNHVLIVVNRDERERILSTFAGEGRNLEDRIIVYNQTEKLLGRADISLGIDNIDMILSRLLNTIHPIEIITLREDE